MKRVITRRLKIFFISLSIFISVLSFMPSLTDAYETTTKILDSGDNLIHGAIYHDSYLWFSTQTTPARIIKMNPLTLNYEKVVLGSGLNYGDDIEYANNFIWVAIKTSPARLIKVTKTSLSWETAITFSSSELNGSQSLVYDYNYLWIGGHNGRIARVNLTSLAYTVYDYSAVVGSAFIHGITSGNNFVLATATRAGTYPAYVLKINYSNPTSYDWVNIGDNTISDDIAYYDGYLYCATELYPYRIYKINGANISDYTFAGVGSSACYGITAQYEKLWAYYYSAPGTIRKLNTSLSVLETIYLSTGYDSANEMVFSDDGIGFVTCWMSPARVVKFVGIVGLHRIQEFTYTVGTLPTISVRMTNDSRYNLINKNVTFRIYLNDSLFDTLTGQTDSEGLFSKSFNKKLYGKGTLLFNFTDTTDNIESYSYHCDYEVKIESFDEIYINPLILQQGQTLNVSCFYKSASTINETHVKLMDVWWKGRVIKAGETSTYACNDFDLYNETSTLYPLRNTWSGSYTDISWTPGTYYLNMTLYLRGSDYYLGSALSTNFNVQQPTGPPTEGGSGMVTSQSLLVIAKDYKLQFIKGAEILVYDKYHGLIGNKTTDIYGTASFTLIKGDYNVTANYGGKTISEMVSVYDEPETLELKFPVEAFITPTELLLDINSILMYVLAIIGIIGAVILERKGYAPVAVVIGLVSVLLFISGGMLTFRLIPPFFTIPSFELPQITLPTFTLPEFALPDFSQIAPNLQFNIFSLTLENIIILAIGISAIILFSYGLYRYMGRREKQAKRTKIGRFKGPVRRK